MFSNIIHGPSRMNGLNSRGANCIWEIKTSQNNTGLQMFSHFNIFTHGQTRGCSMKLQIRLLNLHHLSSFIDDCLVHSCVILSGQFYQQSKSDSKSCRNPVSYLKIREFGSNGKELPDKSNKVHTLTKILFIFFFFSINIPHILEYMHHWY